MNKLIFFLAAVILLSSFSEPPNDTVSLNVMSFNIRYDNPEDSMNNWKYRKDVVAQVIVEKRIDLLGTQEVLENQLNDLKGRLPGYEAVGVGREDGIHKGEHSSIFFKKDRFVKISSGNFWLSETPEKVSVGWDAALERIATWVILKDKRTGVKFLFMNTHLDHRGKEARRNSVSLLLDQAAKLGKGLPIILSGDFNARPESEVVKEMVDPKNVHHLIDSRTIAGEVLGGEGTFHDFSDEPGSEKKEGRIDYIFVNKEITINKYEGLPKKVNNIFLSDHIPIMVNLTIK